MHSSEKKQYVVGVFIDQINRKIPSLHTFTVITVGVATTVAIAIAILL